MYKPCSFCKRIYSYSDNECMTCIEHKRYNEYLEHRRKYCKGKRIKSMAEFTDRINDGERYFYLRDSIKHIGFLCAMQYNTIDRFILCL